MCGIIGVAREDANSSVFTDVVEGLHQLQHRGQDGCGIASAQAFGESYCQKGHGLVSEVFSDSALNPDHCRSFGVGHVRYRTSGSINTASLQPLTSREECEVILVHNGQVDGGKATRKDCLDYERYSDSTQILESLSRGLSSVSRRHPGKTYVSKLLVGLKTVYQENVGSFACIAVIDSSILVGFRDPHGIKPLVWGERRLPGGAIDYMMASESVALEKLGYTVIRDVRPGEAVFVYKDDSSLRTASLQVVSRSCYAPDIFEYVYFARPESVMDGICVHDCRHSLGISMGHLIKQQWSQLLPSIDVIVPVPETAYTSAASLAKTLDIPLSFAIVKNRYTARTFILPSQKARLKAIDRKLSVIRSEFEDRHVLIVDDSIVRGNTSKEIVSMARRAGARRVTFASTSPAIRFNHIYGIDLAQPTSLVAHGRKDDEVAEMIGADEVIYLPLPLLIQCCMIAGANPDLSGFEVGLFNGNYATQRKIVGDRKHSMAKTRLQVAR